jgi:hypothetical protein
MQEVDERGCSAGERVEQALEETKGLLQQLESKIHSMSHTDTAFHTLEPASMIRQVSGRGEESQVWVGGVTGMSGRSGGRSCGCEWEELWV